MSYPVTFECDYVEQRSRLTTFFRYFMIIPHVIVLFVYGVITWFALIGAWFALMFTGKYPPGLYKYVAGFNLWLSQFSGYANLLTDEYPPFWGNLDQQDYPIRMAYSGPLDPYSRLKVFFRFIIGLPIIILRYYVVGPLVFLGAFAAWFVIMFTGKMPKGLQDFMVLGASYTARSDAYMMYLTETYPPFQDTVTGTGGQIGTAPPAPIPAAPEPAAEAPAPTQETPASPESPAGPQSPSGPQSPA